MMEKKFRVRLLLGCLLLAIIPSIVYADYFDSLKVETFPILGSTDVTRGVEFQIRVVALEEDGDQINLVTTIDYGDAQYAPIILDSTDSSAEIYDDSTGQWVSMNTPPFETALDGGGDRIFRIKLHEVGEDKKITAWPGTGWETIDEGFLNFKVHDFVDHFVIEPVPTQTAGVTFNIRITAENSSNKTAETFNDDVNIWAVISQYDPPDMTPSTIDGSSFTRGVAIIPVTIYGSHPVSRLVKVEYRNTVLHGGNYAEGEIEVRVDPNSYAKILLLVDGEEHLPGSFDPDGKQGASWPPWIAGVASPVDVYLTDEWWNPIQSSDIPPATAITFSSSDDPLATFVGPPIMLVNPDTFQVTLYTAGSGHWVRIREGTPVKESVSANIQVDPNNVAYFEFDNPIPQTVDTTDVIDIDVTAYDVSGNVAIDYNGWVDLRCSLGDQYIIPDRIYFSGGTASASARITLRGNNVTITVDDGVNSVESNSFNVYAGDFSRLLVLLDGESHTPGLGDGKSLTPNPITAGESTTVTIIATDDYWNKKAEPVQITDISCPTGYIVPPLPLPVLIKAGIPGEADCQVTFRTARTALGADEPQIITVSGDGRTGDSSPLIVSPRSYSELVLVAPGEQLDPGSDPSGNGKTGSAFTQTAGVSFDNLIVAATDEYWNPIDSGFPDWIYFYSGDWHWDVRFAGSTPWTSKAMDNGIENYSDNTLITLASPQWVRVRGWAPAVGYKYGLANIPVTHGPLDSFVFDTIQSPIIAGVGVDVTITAKDQYGNTVESFKDKTISLTSDKEPAGQYTFSPRWTEPFSNGVSKFILRVYKVDTDVSLTARQWLFSGIFGVLVSGWYEGISNSFNVVPGNYAGLILLLDPPNQIHEPGNILTQGKSGVPDAYTVGAPAIQTIVYAVDQYWNRVHPPDPEPQVELTTANYLYVDANPKTMINGEVTFWTSFRTAGNGQVLVATDMDPITGYSDSSTINVNPGTFTKLQIIAPGENPDPGSNPGGSGKTGSPQSQVAGVSFDLAVRAVDNYWNLVPTINGEGIDLTSQTDIELDSRYPPQPFEAGISTFTIWLDGKNQDVDVTAINQTSPLINPYTVTIFVETGYRYEVVVPSYCTASNNLSQNTFTMTVRLVDDNGDPVTDANNNFQMTPCLAVDYSPATNPDGLGRKEYSLVNGERTFEQSYDTVEEICIKVTDVFGREQYSDAIDVQETALEYRVYVPTQSPVAVAEEFQMTVSLIDTGTENVVPTGDRRVNLVPLSSAEPGREGRLYVNSGVLSRGTLTITNQWYTKAEWIQIEASDAEIYDPPAGDGWSDSFQILPGTLERLQILAPGEMPRPGEWAYVSTGKDSSGLLVQDTEIEFPVTVRAVDQYWNLVDFDGGSVYLSSDNSFSSQPGESSLDNGVATFQVTIHQSGPSFTLKAEAESPAGLQPQRVTIPMEVAKYRITSVISSASTVNTFFLTVELVDSTGEPKEGANNSFILTPYTVSYEEASGKFTIMVGTSALKLVDGYAEVWVNYDTAGKIRIKVSDSFGRPEDYTQLIDIEPVGLKYQVIAPEEVAAGKEFPLTVRLVDSVRETLVAPEEYDSNRQVRLVAYSFPEESLAEGELKEEYLYLQGGEKTIPQSYNFAHKIYIVASDAKTYDYPVTSNPPDSSGVIEVFGTPKTVMKLDGVYSEMNGAIYLRGSTLIRIECISKIVAETILYRDNGSEEKTYGEPFSLSPGAHTIEYWGVDKYEHAEQVNKSKTIYVSFFGEGVDGVSNQPNPFKAGREETLILYNLKQPSNVTITIYDLLGQEVWHKSYREGEEGGSTSNQVSWDGRNLSGKVVANGGYICRIWIQREKRHMVRKIGVAK